MMKPFEYSREKQLEEENKILREALEFISDNWNGQAGEIARQALEQIKEIKTN